jgi:hypothetical protein
MMTKFSDFDLDFSKGKEGEDLVSETLLSGTIEVKTDLRWKDTGNLYVETECFYQTSQSWEPSGLSVTKADYWAFVLNGLIVILPTEDLRIVVEAEGTPVDCKIEPNPSRGFLIRPEHILRKFKYAPSGD